MPALSGADWAALRAREIVVFAETRGQHVESTGVVLASVPPDVLWPAVLDLRARLAENDSLVAVEEYARAGAEAWSVRFEMSVFGFGATFHNRFRWDRAASWVTYDLDPERPNDLVSCDGWYLVRPEGTGSLFVYHSANEAKAWAPGWVWRWLATDSMEVVLGAIRDRAEHGLTGR